MMGCDVLAYFRQLRGDGAFADAGFTGQNKKGLGGAEPFVNFAEEPLPPGEIFSQALNVRVKIQSL